MKFRPTLLALGLALAAIGATTARAEGNVANGKISAYTCQGCHGIPNYKNAFPSYSVPMLGGQHAKYLEVALQAYASGDRAHPTMYSHAAEMDDQTRADIAAFFSGEQTPRSEEVIGTPPPAVQTCAACHGANGAKSIAEDYPIIAGQKADYIVQALKDYKSGKRKNPIMAGIVAGVEEAEFDAIARFFSRQDGGLCTTDRIAQHGQCK